MEVLCSRDQCLVEGQVVEELREGELRGLYSWRPANHSDFWGRTLEEGIRGKLGALRPDPMVGCVWYRVDGGVPRIVWCVHCLCTLCLQWLQLATTSSSWPPY